MKQNGTHFKQKTNSFLKRVTIFCFLDKCVIHCKSSLGFGQLALVLKTKCKVLVGRYRFSEFYECRE